jgi:hypothetical protein
LIKGVSDGSTSGETDGVTAGAGVTTGAGLTTGAGVELEVVVGVVGVEVSAEAEVVIATTPPTRRPAPTRLTAPIIFFIMKSIL